uniref:Uncharacterized protein n=1 Tax=Sphaerodactylus townsendi TaxID=933632 RepID=A0ACB8EY59_9SAUR
MDLHCVVLGDNTSVLQWSKPPFTIFLGRHQGLKDKRYQLINSSVDRLSVRISNVTTDDEGLYTCYHYGAEGTAKQVNVTILAAPSKPLLEESTIRAHNKEEIIILRCSTQKSKPRPQITWLLDNGIELFGDTHHQCEQNGKKCNTTSSLKVRTFNQKSTITCVVRHKALGGGNLTATIHLSHIKSTTDTVPTTSEFGMTTLEHPWRYTANILNMTEENFRTQRSPLSSKADTPNSTTTNGMSGTNVTYEGFLKKPSKLLPILVATLLSILSVAVLLLLVKVWKAHREWKRENDSSDPTLENYKARPNEDNHAQNRHGELEEL